GRGPRRRRSRRRGAGRAHEARASAGRPGRGRARSPLPGCARRRARAARGGARRPRGGARPARGTPAAARAGARARRARRRAALGEALEAFERLGMPLWAARAREELARIGGRTPGDALTTTERRVAELAARGSSNKEIAAALFVTVKTVEATLSRVYRKLGVRSRAALGRALGGQTVGEPPLPPGSGAS